MSNAPYSPRPDGTPILPHDEQAEQAVLSSILAVPESFDEISNILKSTDFYEPKNEIIFETAVQLRENGANVDAISINAAIQQQGLSAQSGGIAYLTEILSPNNLTAFSSDPISYARLVSDYARRRKLISISREIEQSAYLGTETSAASADEATEYAEQEIIDFTNSADSVDVLSAADMFDSTITLIEETGNNPAGSVSGIGTGFPKLDDLTTGFHPAQITLVGARPAVGKSAIALDFARAAAYLGGKSVLFFSLEMKTEELMLRLLSAEARVEQQNIKKGHLTQEEWMNLSAVKERIKSGSLFFDTTAEVGLSHIRSRAIRQQLSPAGLDLIVVDYLQLMQVPAGNKNTNREQQVSALSRGLKLLAKMLDVPIIILSQLNRNSETRVDKKPAMSDLRESGAIEQDMDVILLLHRPEQSDPNLRPGEADLIIAKNRHGPTDTVPLTPMLQYSKFVPGEGIIQRDDENYQNVDETGEPVYSAPSEEDTIPW